MRRDLPRNMSLKRSIICKSSYLSPEGVGRLTDLEQGANDVILTGLDAHAPEGAVKRRLKARHISMVSSKPFERF